MKERRVMLIAGAATALAALVVLWVYGGSGAVNTPSHPPHAESRTKSAPPPATQAHAAKPAARPPASRAESTPRAAPSSRVVVSAPWGAGKGELGRKRPTEGNPEGPMSFAVDSQGRLLVLDQVNGRMVRYGADGKPLSEVPLNLRSPQDVATGTDGSTAVMDRLVNKSVAIYDADGKLKGEIPLEGEHVPTGGLVSGVFVDGNDIYVEREHGSLVRIGDTQGHAASDRTEIPGRPSRDGLSLLRAGISGPEEGRVYVTSFDRATKAHRFTRELHLNMPARSIHLLDTDRQGTIYLGVLVEPAPNKELLLLSCLEPEKGVPIGKAELPVNTMPEETFRTLVVLDGGGVLSALMTPSGITYERYDCR